MTLAPDRTRPADSAEQREKPVLVAPSRQLVRRRQRALIGFSMLAVIPAFIFSVGATINVAVAQAATVSYQQKDWDGSAAWSRANLAINPFDAYLPNFNLGTAYARGGLLDDAVAPLKEAITAAPSKEAVCPARANLALTYEQLGDRAAAASSTTEAQKDYATAKLLWDKTSGDVCYRSKAFQKKADAAEKRLEKKLQQQEQKQQQEQQQQQQQQGQNGQGQDQNGQSQNGQSQNGQDQNGQSQNDPNQDQNGQGQNQSGDSGDGGRKSETLGDKLGQLEKTDEESQQARDQGNGSASGGSGTSKPW